MNRETVFTRPCGDGKFIAACFRALVAEGFHPSWRLGKDANEIRLPKTELPKWQQRLQGATETTEGSTQP
jgi:hypothetical protein